MLPWRKPKSHDDDEPLVPQGFITQSLEEKPKLEVVSRSSDAPVAQETKAPVDSPPDSSQMPAGPIEPRAESHEEPLIVCKPPKTTTSAVGEQPARLPMESNADQHSSAKASAQPLLHKPRATPTKAEAKAELAEMWHDAGKRYQNGLEIVRRNAHALGDKRKSINISPHLEAARALVSRSADAVRRWTGTCAQRIFLSASSASKVLKSHFADLRKLSGERLSHFKTQGADKYAQLKTRSASQVSHVNTGVVAGFAAFKAQAVPRLLALRARAVSIPTQWRSRFASARQEFIDSASAYRAKTIAPPKAVAETQPQPKRELRIKLEGVPLRTRIALARIHSEWRLGSHPLAENTRLWTSLALGAVSALLVMGIFSATVHYGNEALPGKHRLVNANQGSVIPAAVVELPTPQPTARVRPKLPAIQSGAAEAPLSVNSAAATRPAHSAASATPKPLKSNSALRRKPRHDAEDDYVAKDTYVYYGSSSRSSR